MRSFLFGLVGRSCIIYATCSDWLFSRLANMLLTSSVWVKIKVATIAMTLLVMIDSERVDEEQRQNEENRSRNELNLMQTAIRLKEHAMEHGEWSDVHTEALNDIGTVLMNECNWEEARAHEYLTSILEGVPGLDWYIDEE